MRTIIALHRGQKHNMGYTDCVRAEVRKTYTRTARQAAKRNEKKGSVSR